MNDASYTEDSQTLGGDFNALSVLGLIPHAVADEIRSKIYLPFANGTTGVVSQGANGTTSHSERTALTAVDFGLQFGTEVRPLADGVVVYVVNRHQNFSGPQTVYKDFSKVDPSYDLGYGFLGNFVTVRHTILINGEARVFYATYAHLDPRVAVVEQSPVFIGMKLGLVGRTGAIMGDHVHVQIGWALNADKLIADGRSFSERGESPSDLMSYLIFAENGLAWPQEPIPIGGIPVTSHNSPSVAKGSQTQTAQTDPNIVDVFVAKTKEGVNPIWSRRDLVRRRDYGLLAQNSPGCTNRFIRNGASYQARWLGVCDYEWP